jgi:hypothetical protein
MRANEDQGDITPPTRKRKSKVQHRSNDHFECQNNANKDIDINNDNYSHTGCQLSAVHHLSQARQVLYSPPPHPYISFKICVCCSLII